MKTLFILITFVSTLTWARTQTPAYRSMPVGSDSVNTGFESLSCTQMIGNFLTYVGRSGLGQESIDRRFTGCLAQARNAGVISGVLSAVKRATGGTPEAEQACLDAANREQQNFEDAKQRFITALETRENIYNQKNVSNPNYLNNCTPAKVGELNRRSGESDYDLIRRGMFNCKMNPDLLYRYNLFRDAYANPQDFAEHEVCRNYRVAYFEERYPPRRASSSATAQPETASGRPQVVCQNLTCDQVMRPNAVNNPSPCYRNAVINCMSGVDANSGAVTAPARSNTGQ